MDFKSLFLTEAKRLGYRCEISEEESGEDLLYTCHRGSVEFEFFVEMNSNQPVSVQYRLLGNDDNEVFYYQKEGQSLTDDDLSEVINWMLEEVDEQYYVITKFERAVNKLFSMVENDKELTALYNIFLNKYNL